MLQRERFAMRIGGAHAAEREQTEGGGGCRQGRVQLSPGHLNAVAAKISPAHVAHHVAIVDWSQQQRRGGKTPQGQDEERAITASRTTLSRIPNLLSLSLFSMLSVIDLRMMRSAAAMVCAVHAVSTNAAAECIVLVSHTRVCSLLWSVTSSEHTVHKCDSYRRARREVQLLTKRMQYTGLPPKYRDPLPSYMPDHALQSRQRRNQKV